jgi:hypothetical protein
MMDLLLVPWQEDPTVDMLIDRLEIYYLTEDALDSLINGDDETE